MNTSETILNEAWKPGLIRPRDLEAQGIPHSFLQQLYEQGALVRSGRGIYMLPDWQPSETLSLAEACSRVLAVSFTGGLYLWRIRSGSILEALLCCIQGPEGILIGLYQWLGQRTSR